MPANITLIDSKYIHTKNPTGRNIKIISYVFLQRKMVFIIRITIRKFGVIRLSNIDKKGRIGYILDATR